MGFGKALLKSNLLLAIISLVYGLQQGCQMSYSNASSCGKVCISVFEGEGCEPQAAATLTIGDTGGDRLDLSSYGQLQIRSLQYKSPTTVNSSGCDPIMFLFYNSLNQSYDVAFLTPGQRKVPVPCHDFLGDVAMKYAGVTMLVPVPEYYNGGG